MITLLPWKKNSLGNMLMDNRTSTLTLKTAINEVKSTCPGISDIFLFNEDLKPLIYEENTPEESFVVATNALSTLNKITAMAGEIECLTCYGSNQKINLSHITNNYIITVASNETDDAALSSITRVLIPTVLKTVREVVSSREETPIIPKSPPSKRDTLKLQPTKPPVTDIPAADYVVENLSVRHSLSTAPGMILVDRALIGEWKERYGNKEIEEVTVENISTKKRLKCSIQAIKDSKLEGQGVVQIPTRLQAALEIRKGEVVRIRPILKD